MDQLSVNKSRYLALILLACYIVSCGVEGLYYGSLAGNALQLPELTFLVLAAVLLINIKALRPLRLPLMRLDYALVLYASAVLFSYLSTGQVNALGELLGITYFLGLYTLVGLLLLRSGPQTSGTLLKAAVVSGVAAATAAIIGWAMLYWWQDDRMAVWFPNYPLIGDTIRVRGLHRGPIILADFLGTVLLAVFLQYRLDYRLMKWPIRTSVVVIGIGLLLTLTKSMLILYFVLVWTVTRLYKNLATVLRGILRLTAWAALLLYFVTSHVFIIADDDPRYDEKIVSPYSSCEVYQSPVEGWKIVPSVYTSQKKLALIAGLRHIPFGVGGNQLIKYNKEIYEEGLLACQNRLTPHSTYFGTFGELGIYGFLALLFLLYTVYQTIHQSGMTGDQLIAAKAILLYVVLQGVTADFMNLRHYWVLLIVLSVFQRRELERL